MMKAAFFDIDGTLLSHTNYEIPKSTRKALHLLREKGVKVFLATGRSIEEAKRVPWEDIVFDGYVTLNGQICLDAEENILYGASIQGSDLAYLCSIFTNKEIPLTIVEKDKMYINFVNEQAKKANESVSIPLPPIAEYSGEPVYQFIGYFGRDREAQFQEKLQNCKITRWHEESVDILSKEGGKVTGIQKMMEAYGLSREEIIAFGDGDNDMEMLEFAGIGVAMGNAADNVKEHADYVTDHIDEDGLWNALKHFEIL